MSESRRQTCTDKLKPAAKQERVLERVLELVALAL
jgi:hypothetical protein